MSKDASSARGRQLTLAIVAILVLAGAILLLLRGKGETSSLRPASPRQYMYDLTAGKLIVADPARQPPSREVVVAKVFACGSCAVETDRFAGWLEKDNPQFQPGGNAAPNLMAWPDDRKWAPADAAAMSAAKDKLAQRCGAKPVVKCEAP